MFRQPLLSFGDFEADLEHGLDTKAEERPEDKIYLSQVMIGCARALLLCLDADHRLAYVLGEVMSLDGAEAAAICAVTPQAYRKRLSRSRELVREALSKHCGIVEASAACRCHRRLHRARELGRLSDSQEVDVDVSRLREVVHEMTELSLRVSEYHQAEPDALVSSELAARIRELPARTL